MVESRKLKGLQTQLRNLKGEYESLKIECANKQREVQQKKVTIDSIESEIAKMNTKTNIKVSEHAVLRYLERISGLDIENIEKLILNENVLNLINQLGGNGTYPNTEFKVVVKDFVVTTIVPNNR